MQYTIKQGDCVLSLAKTHGFLWHTIWDHPKNAALKALRHGDPSVLLPGDNLFIPDIRQRKVDAAVDRLHKYVVKNSPTEVRLRLLDFRRRPRASLKYSASVDGVTSTGATDAEGFLTLYIPADAQEVSLEIVGVPRDESYTLPLGYIDPHDAISGIQQRLTNLGFECLSEAGTVGAATQAALRAFQNERGLEETGVIDDATRSALKSLHGC